MLKHLLNDYIDMLKEQGYKGEGQLIMKTLANGWRESALEDYTDLDKGLIAQLADDYDKIEAIRKLEHLKDNYGLSPEAKVQLEKSITQIKEDLSDRAKELSEEVLTVDF